MNTAYDYDCVVIGGGLAGLTCGLKCLAEGLSCAVISSGMSALHFSSGSIDLLGHHPGREVVFSPMDTLPDFINTNPGHPYAKCGLHDIVEAMDFLHQEINAQGTRLFSNGRYNHFHITAVGTLKPTFFSPASVFTQEIKTVFEKKPCIAILNIKGFRDFHPVLAAANLNRHRLFSHCRITCGEIELPGQKTAAYGTADMRSVDVARILDSASDLRDVAEAVSAASGKADIVALPALLGLNRYPEIVDELRRSTDRLIYEIPTLPPSILGMRLDNALKARFAAQGGIFIASETIESGTVENDRVVSIHTLNQGDDIRAACYVLASGSFFSKGLSSRYGRMTEPVFDCRLDIPPDCKSLAAESFFSPKSHDFLRAGVKTDERLNPETTSGQAVTNLYCAGAVLSSYNPVNEGSGGGVAVATGYKAAKQIVARIVNEKHPENRGPE
jgi:glycerol-3-phosphate dehydrogenase subunit B